MNQLTKVTSHVYWLPPAPPDRPSLCAVVGDRWTLMLDAGASVAHTRSFLDALTGEREKPPSAVVYTHSDWDHVFGGAETRSLVLAHELTAARLREMARMDWSDEALDRRVTRGSTPLQHVLDIKAELPSPRRVEIAQADVVFGGALHIDLGGRTVRVQHVGGDHARDSCVMFVEPDSVLFLGDCLGASPAGTLTTAVLDVCRTILQFDAAHYIEGHHPAISSRSDMEELFAKIEAAEHAAREHWTIHAPDEETAYYLRAFTAAHTPPTGPESRP